MKKKQGRKSKIEKAFEKEISKGWKMSKLVKAGGLFLDSTYDDRTVYTINELLRLSKKGYSVDESMGKLALNILLKAI